jgi:hypothetical protein
MIYHVPEEHTFGTPQSGAIPPKAEQLATLSPVPQLQQKISDF